MGKAEKSSFNIFDHVLVPKHIVLSKEEAEAVLKKYHVKPYQLPYIKASDPAAKAIGAKPGDIVKIIRKSSTAGEVVVYRYVVKD
ncbi:MAG: DNA-directed RNA polymerase subunit H [Candidatus Bathyarchaeia archaeon]